MTESRPAGARPAIIGHRDVLAFTTRQAAEALGLGDQIGTLSMGKYADLIAIQAEDLSNMPVNGAIGAIADCRLPTANCLQAAGSSP